MPGTEAPLVSVVVTTHNFERFVDAAVDAVLAQTFSDFELILVDDGSTDGTRKRIRDHIDPRIRIVDVEGRGAPAAANAGLKRARGKYLALWDGDDLWKPQALERHVEALERDPRLAFTFSWCGLIDEDGREMGAGFRRWRGVITVGQMLEDFVVGTNSAVLFRHASVAAAGGFDERLSHCYDMDLCLRLAAVPGSARAIEEELTHYRRHRVQMSRDWRAIQADWERMVSALRVLAPSDLGPVEVRARSNMQRYFAFLVYESGAPREGLRLLLSSLKSEPGAFFRDARNFELLFACLVRMAMPSALVDPLEGAAVRLLRGRRGRAGGTLGE